MAEREWKPQIRKVSGAGGNERERLQAVHAMIRDKRFEEAHDELSQLIRENGKAFDPHFMMSVLYQRQRKFSEALESLKNALAIEPKNVQALIRAGQYSLFLDKDKPNNAEGYFSQVLEAEPNNAEGHVGMAQVFQRLGTDSKAIEHLQQALKIDPQMARARILLARLLHKAGKSQEATAELESFVGADPSSSVASALLARVYNSEGRKDEAAEVLESVARLYPTSSNIWVELGRMRLAQEDYSGAEEAFREASKHGQQEVVGSIQLFKALLPQGKFDEAYAVLKNVPRRGPLAPVVHKCYGDIYAAQGNYDDAMKSYRASLMHGESGQKLLSEIEKEATAKVDPEDSMKCYQAAVEKLATEARENRAQAKSSGLLQRFASRRRADGGARLRP